MSKYIAVHAVYVPNPNFPDKSEKDILALPGTEVELSDELAKPHLKVGALRSADEQPAEVPESEPPAPVPDRPSNNASKDEWRAYATALGIDDLPADAKRDEIIAAVDAHSATG
jgi:hypothetical protein